MLIRNANFLDCEDIFKWRNDQSSRAMSIDQTQLNYAEHLEWFKKSLTEPRKKIYISEIEGIKAGVIRFDLDIDCLKAEVSINMNPIMCNKGYGKVFLVKSIDSYLNKNNVDLCAQIKTDNIISQKIFSHAGFCNVSKRNEVFYFERSLSIISFKEVNTDDTKILYELLKSRSHSISHDSIPSYKDHANFVRKYPYEHWCLIYESKVVVGTFYIQKDNSIGLNLLSPTLRVVNEVINYITKNFSTNSEVKSKIPPYFFINAGYSNNNLIKALNEVGCKPIQISYKVN
tara:strand:+ start:115 stop:975 length:861 start_codon:yes stop_codon:yes gene_type:complete